MTISERIRAWFDVRPEYRDASWPTSVAPLIVAEVTMSEMQDWLERTIRRAIGDVARGDGKNAVRDFDGGTIYIDPVELPLFEYVEKYVKVQRRRVDADLAKLRGMNERWVAAHPEQGITADELWRMAEAA